MAAQQPGPAGTRRDRVRTATTAEIKATARRCWWSRARMP